MMPTAIHNIIRVHLTPRSISLAQADKAPGEAESLMMAPTVVICMVLRGPRRC